MHGWDDGLSKRELYLLPVSWQGARPVVNAGLTRGSRVTARV